MRSCSKQEFINLNRHESSSWKLFQSPFLEAILRGIRARTETLNCAWANAGTKSIISAGLNRRQCFCV